MTLSRQCRTDDLFARARNVLPGGVNSNVRLLGEQVFFDRASGSRMVDVEGKVYIDYLLGQGPNFLGHAHPDVNAAVADAVRHGMVFGGQHPNEVEAAEILIDSLGWAEQVRIGMSGTECVQAALRLARAVTGRTKFVRFAGHYHGWLDNVLVGVDPDGHAAPASAGQVVSHLDDSFMLPWNDLSAVEKLLADRADEIAALIMEPIMFNTGSIEPVTGFLSGVREACDKHGVVLIFDEVITGFRVALGGASEMYGVVPDLATYGKAMAGGWPVAALAGRRELMELFGTGEVNHSGTFNASVMACAAITASIGVLRDDPPYARLAELGGRLMGGLRELGLSHGLRLNVQGLPMAFHVGIGPGPFTSYDGLSKLDGSSYQTLVKALVDHGVWVAGRGIWYLSAVHDDTDIDETLERADAAMASLQ